MIPAREQGAFRRRWLGCSRGFAIVVTAMIILACTAPAATPGAITPSTLEPVATVTPLPRATDAPTTAEPTPLPTSTPIEGHPAEVRDLVGHLLLERTSRDLCVQDQHVTYDLDALLSRAERAAGELLEGVIDDRFYVGARDDAGAQLVGGELVGTNGGYAWFILPEGSLPKGVLAGAALLTALQLADGRTVWFLTDDRLLAHECPPDD